MMALLKDPNPSGAGFAVFPHPAELGLPHLPPGLRGDGGPQHPNSGRSGYLVGLGSPVGFRMLKGFSQQRLGCPAGVGPSPSERLGCSGGSGGVWGAGGF